MMNLKKTVVSGTLGGIVDFLLGWVFYGIIFYDLYPEGESMNLINVFLGCMTNGYFISYILTNWVRPVNVVTGVKSGAIIGFFTSLSMNLFMYATMPINFKNMAIDLVITTIMSALVALVIAFTNKKLN